MKYDLMLSIEFTATGNIDAVLKAHELKKRVENFGGLNVDVFDCTGDNGRFDANPCGDCDKFERDDSGNWINNYCHECDFEPIRKPLCECYYQEKVSGKFEVKCTKCSRKFKI